MYRFNYKGTDIVVISDTQGKHRKIDIPQCDILIHLGDVCNFGSQSEMVVFKGRLFNPNQHAVL